MKTLMYHERRNLINLIEAVLESASDDSEDSTSEYDEDLLFVAQAMVSFQCQALRDHDSFYYFLCARLLKTSRIGNFARHAFLHNPETTPVESNVYADWTRFVYAPDASPYHIRGFEKAWAKYVKKHTRVSSCKS